MLLSPASSQSQSKLTLLTACAILLFSAGLPGINPVSIWAQGDSLRSPRVVYPKPSLPRPPRAGSKFIEPTFGTEIMRATDERDDPVGLSTYYSHWPTFNSNNTYILVRKGLGGDALIKPFNADAFTVSRGYKPGLVDIPAKGAVAMNLESAIWHPSNPELLYCFTGYRDGGMRLYTYNVVTQSYSLVKDFSGLGTLNDYLWEMSISADGDVFAWSQMRVGRQDNPIYYLVWRKSADKVLSHAPTNGIINKVRLDKSGRYLALQYANIGADQTKNAYLTLATGHIEPIKWNASDSPTGHGDLGTGFIAGFDNWASGINRRWLNNVHAPQLVFRFQDANGAVDWTNDLHGTMLADNEDWITIGTYHEPSSTSPSTGVFTDQIMQVALDGSGRWRRICYTRSSIDNRSDATGYWATPKPTISRDGRFIAFTSNWEKSGRFDVFIARITPAPILSKPIRFRRTQD